MVHIDVLKLRTPFSCLPDAVKERITRYVSAVPTKYLNKHFVALSNCKWQACLSLLDASGGGFQTKSTKFHCATFLDSSSLHYVYVSIFKAVLDMLHQLKAIPTYVQMLVGCSFYLEMHNLRVVAMITNTADLAGTSTVEERFSHAHKNWEDSLCHADFNALGHLRNVCNEARERANHLLVSKEAEFLESITSDGLDGLLVLRADIQQRILLSKPVHLKFIKMVSPIVSSYEKGLCNSSKKRKLFWGSIRWHEVKLSIFKSSKRLDFFEVIKI